MKLYNFQNGITIATLPDVGTIQSNIKADFSFPYSFLQMDLDHDTKQVSGNYAVEGNELIELNADQLIEIQKYMSTISFDKSVSDAHHKNQHNKKFLAATDWVEALYIRDVVRKQVMTQAEFDAKYQELLDKREAAIAEIVDLTPAANA